MMLHTAMPPSHIASEVCTFVYKTIAAETDFPHVAFSCSGSMIKQVQETGRLVSFFAESIIVKGCVSGRCCQSLRHAVQTLDAWMFSNISQVVSTPPCCTKSMGDYADAYSNCTIIEGQEMQAHAKNWQLHA